MSTHRDFVEALQTQLETDVTGTDAATGWTFHLYEPIAHPAGGAHCAIWFNGETVDDQFNTAGTHDMVEEYRIRYWEPAPEGALATVDEQRAEAVQNIYDAVVASIYGTQALSNRYQVWFRAGEMLIGGAGEESRRGFEIALMGRRVQDFT